MVIVASKPNVSFDQIATLVPEIMYASLYLRTIGSSEGLAYIAQSILPTGRMISEEREVYGNKCLWHSLKYYQALA
jgi:hypothetical protein